MMNLIIKCDGCNKEMSIADSETRLVDELIIKVVPCSDCPEPDCSKCEDIESYKQQIIELQQQIDELKKEE